MSKTKIEPLLTENPNRYVMFPLQDEEIWQHYKKMEALCKGGKSRIQKNSPSKYRSLCADEIQALDDLRLKFGSKIKLKPITGNKSGTSGRIELHYNNIEDLERLLDKLKR